LFLLKEIYHIRQLYSGIWGKSSTRLGALGQKAFYDS
jgi:hypothetical protein